MARSLSDDLRQGYREVEGALSDQERALLACAREPRNRARAGRSQHLAAIVAAYRAGPRWRWAPVLLDLLAPALLARLQLLRAERPVLDEEDLRQQLVVEVLQAAATVPLPDDARSLKSRLILRASQGVRRRLERERQIQRAQESLDAVEERQK